MAGRGTCEAWKPRSYAEMQHRMAVGVRHRPPLGPASEKARGDHPQEAGGGDKVGNDIIAWDRNKATRAHTSARMSALSLELGRR